MRPKSKVLTREEKAVGGVDMKRLLLCGLIAGLGYGLSRLLPPLRGLTLPVVAVSFGVALILTGQLNGMPRYVWWLEGWRGALLIAARTDPSGLAARWCEWVQWNPSEIVVNGSRLFASTNPTTASDWEGVQIVERLDDLEAVGFEIIPETGLLLIEEG